MVVLIWAAIRANVSLDAGALLRHFPPHLKHLLGSSKTFWKYLEIWDCNIDLRHTLECAAQEHFMLLFSFIDRILWGIYVLAGAINSVIGALSINKAFFQLFLQWEISSFKSAVFESLPEFRWLVEYNRIPRHFLCILKRACIFAVSVIGQLKKHKKSNCLYFWTNVFSGSNQQLGDK